MPCYRPVQAYQSIKKKPNGKSEIFFSLYEAQKVPYSELLLPCGSCNHCRLKTSAGNAVRCVHEASMYQDNCFITLTYDPKYLPTVNGVGTLNVKDFQDFMKRLRDHCDRGFKYVDPRTGEKEKYEPRKVRMYYCGEYGEKRGRPHYHAILFNVDFPDKQLWEIRNGYPLYRSAFLEKLWPYGHSSVGTATFESAAYVARYIMKKVNGDRAFLHYAIMDKDTGEYFGQRKPEFVNSSQSVGRDWFNLYWRDVYPKDFIVINGKRYAVPKAYDRLYQQIDPIGYTKIKFKREAQAILKYGSLTPENFEAARVIKDAQIEKLVRNFEGDHLDDLDPLIDYVDLEF